MLLLVRLCRLYNYNIIILSALYANWCLLVEELIPTHFCQVGGDSYITRNSNLKKSHLFSFKWDGGHLEQKESVRVRNHNIVNCNPIQKFFHVQVYILNETYHKSHTVHSKQGQKFWPIIPWSAHLCKTKIQFLVLIKLHYLFPLFCWQVEAEKHIFRVNRTVGDQTFDLVT